jgi:hypothetical protein
MRNLKAADPEIADAIPDHPEGSPLARAAEQ